MPRRIEFKERKSTHWWNDSIAELRRAAIVARRSYQRAGRRPGRANWEVGLVAYNKARTELKYTIRKAQERSWLELCRSVNSDPWGIPYRLVTKRLGRRPPILDQSTTVNVARSLFPLSPPIDWKRLPMAGGDNVTVSKLTVTSTQFPLFTPEEVASVVSKLPLGKAPDPDLIPNELIKLIYRKFPEIFRGCFNSCLVEGVFPSGWKRAKLVLLYKGRGKPRDEPLSYRPISLLDGSGKVFERLLLERLNEHIHNTGALSDLQFGFRRFRSTIDAIGEILNVAKAAGSGPVQNRHLCVLITLDVKNAFNLAPWRLIDAALRRYVAPEYLVKILRSYMSNRELLVGDDACLSVTCGVPQGSVLSPTLWNLFYDDLLRLPVPDDVKLVAFADDVAVVGVAHNAELVEQLVNPVLKDISEWMTENGLQLALDKSECVVLTKKHVYRNPELHVHDCPVPVKSSIRYLGVQLDTRLSFGEHVATVAAGARKAASALGRPMLNVDGHSQCKRRLLMSVVRSRLLYGAPIWADNIKNADKYTNLLLPSQRCAALRVARCFRMVSDMAALVLARMPPLTILAAGRKRAAAEKKVGAVRAKAVSQEEIIQEWQLLWDATTTKAAWTKRLIPDVRKLWVQGPTEMSFHMAQVLSGHSCFQWYLWNRRRAASPACVHCSTEVDDAEHTVFSCPFWEDARAELQLAVGRPTSPDDVMYLLCGVERDQLPDDPLTRTRVIAVATRHGQLFRKRVEVIMGEKEEVERRRQRQENLI